MNILRLDCELIVQLTWPSYVDHGIDLNELQAFHVPCTVADLEKNLGGFNISGGGLH